MIPGPSCWFPSSCSPRHHGAETNHPHSSSRRELQTQFSHVRKKTCLWNCCFSSGHKKETLFLGKPVNCRNPAYFQSLMACREPYLELQWIFHVFPHRAWWSQVAKAKLIVKKSAYLEYVWALKIPSFRRNIGSLTSPLEPFKNCHGDCMFRLEEETQF